MGSCHSKAQGGDARASRPISGQGFPSSKSSYIPSHIPPPTYPMDHNMSCRVLRPWELDGEKSRGYRYIVYVNDNNLLNKRQQNAQDLILEIIQQYAAIQGLTVWVKCLDYLSEEESDADAEREKRFCKDVLATDSKSELIRMWDQRLYDVLPLPSARDEQSQQRRKTLESSEREIQDVIERIRNSKGLDDADAKSQIEPELVAALSRFNRGWKLDKFLVNKTQTFGKAPNIEAEGISKLQAQFFLQARAAYTSLDAPKDPYQLLQFIFSQTKYLVVFSTTFGTTWLRRERGHQWQKLDDEKSGGMDIIDHMPLDIDLLLNYGPGPFFGPKLMLGSIDPDTDRSSKRKDRSPMLYGEKCTRLTREEMEKCPCQTEPMSDQTTSPRIQPAQK
ncbi:hypothetical protein CC78DRAFT_548039 [Lojkania enalia]|uniref:Uncharacterized protein n=1 Tax=Lojkania enalia TaxID=147567 RepID=A0A9P4K2S2_9PLEO|nr:hypothetical protein CC78DRAFT_548039 [Didymosphaeria enalia]